MSVILHLVRHGQSTGNVAGTLTGSTDVPLSEHGRKQALALKPVLQGRSYDAVWTSDLQRAAHTARLAWGHAEPREQLRELDFGELEGTTWADVAAKFSLQLKDFETFAAPGGESMPQFTGRISGFFDTLDPGHHLVFAHGGVIRVVLKRVGFTQFVPNASLSIVNWSESRLIEQVQNPLAE